MRLTFLFLFLEMHVIDILVSSFMRLIYVIDIFDFLIFGRHEIDFVFFNCVCETNVWLILILMTTKQGLELMIIFQV